MCLALGIFFVPFKYILYNRIVYLVVTLPVLLKCFSMAFESDMDIQTSPEEGTKSLSKRKKKKQS